MGGPKQLQTGAMKADEKKPASAKPAPMEKIGDSLILNYNGNEIALRNLINNRPIVILKFTALWCAPCLAAEKSLIKLAKQNDLSLKGVLVVSIDIDMGPTGFVLHGRQNPIGINFNHGTDGKADTGCLLYVNGKPRKWEDFPYAENGFRTTGLGLNENEISRMLQNIKTRVNKK